MKSFRSQFRSAITGTPVVANTADISGITNLIPVGHFEPYETSDLPKNKNPFLLNAADPAAVLQLTPEAINRFLLPMSPEVQGERMAQLYKQSILACKYS